MSFLLVCVFLFFFKQKTAYEMRISDWSSDVCSSDLVRAVSRVNWSKVVSGGVSSTCSARNAASRASSSSAFGAAMANPPFRSVIPVSRDEAIDERINGPLSVPVANHSPGASTAAGRAAGRQATATVISAAPAAQIRNSVGKRSEEQTSEL